MYGSEVSRLACPLACRNLSAATCSDANALAQHLTILGQVTGRSNLQEHWGCDTFRGTNPTKSRAEVPPPCRKPGAHPFLAKVLGQFVYHKCGPAESIIEIFKPTWMCARSSEHSALGILLPDMNSVSNHLLLNKSKDCIASTLFPTSSVNTS